MDGNQGIQILKSPGFSGLKKESERFRIFVWGKNKKQDYNYFRYFSNLFNVSEI
jgi:hypothetical protein